MINKNKLHYCAFIYPDAWQGLEPVVDNCLEEETGYLWLHNGNFDCADIIVNYCPFCGYKALNQIESVK